MAVLCLPWLRWAQPNLPRPIRVPLVFPIVYLLATVFVTVVPMYASPVETGYGILMILSSIPVYLLFIAWKRKPIWFQKCMGKSHGHTTSCFRPLSFSVCVHQILLASTVFHMIYAILPIVAILLGGLTQALQKLMMVVRPKAASKVFLILLLILVFLSLTKKLKLTHTHTYLPALCTI